MEHLTKVQYHKNTNSAANQVSAMQRYSESLAKSTAYAPDANLAAADNTSSYYAFERKFLGVVMNSQPGMMYWNGGDGGGKASSEGGDGLNNANNIAGGVGVVGTGASMVDGTFRLTKSGSFSLGYYASGWQGNQYVKATYSVSKAGNVASTGANLVTTGIAYYQIANGSAQSITYVDAGIGTMGIIASGASYFYGVQIPVVGEAVAIYGVTRVTWDVFFNLGANYGPSRWYGTNDTKWFK